MSIINLLRPSQILRVTCVSNKIVAYFRAVCLTTKLQLPCILLRAKAHSFARFLRLLYTLLIISHCFPRTPAHAHTS